MAALKPRFSDDERQELRGVHGLTGPQLMWLERDLGVVLDEMGPHSRMQDVRSELESLLKEIDNAAKRIGSWERSSRPSYKAEALGHLNIAGAQFESAGSRAGDDSTRPAQVVASQLIKLLAQVAGKALADARSKSRRQHPASPRAIAKILERLHRPTDDASRKAANALTVTYAESRRNAGKPSFRRVVDIVFTAVHRTLSAHAGNPPDSKPASSVVSIRAYLAQQPEGKRRSRGRPKKGRIPD